MKFVITPEEYADLTMMFLLDNILNLENEKFVPLMKNEKFKEQILYLESKNVKTQWTKYFLRLDSKYKNKYKHFKKVFDDGFLGSEIIEIKQSPDAPETKPGNKKKKDNDKESLVRKAVKSAVKLITNKHEPNPKKLALLEENVCKYLFLNGDLDD